MIRNPILPGFNPDPSICRVGDEYFIATSTFEWQPGVRIHRSRDLANWELVALPLDRADLLDMRGEPDSCGIWAPCLSHADGLFWLVYTDVRRYDGNFKDAHNYVVTAPDVRGPWSARAHVNSSGFDPSLFHDDDGRKWFLNMLWDHRGGSVGGHPKSPSFGGILLQRWDAEARRLVGEPRNIFKGSAHGLVEGPHLSKRDDWYHLTVAEGGTGYRHAVTMARSRAIEGPYELHPAIHVVTSKDAPDAPLQRAGHGQIVETPDGGTYMVHLCSRPLPGTRRSPLGRETAIQRCIWRDGWLWLADGGAVPSAQVAAPDPAADAASPEPERVDFRGLAKPPLAFQWPRTPETARIFALGADGLRLFGRESIGSWFEQALVARRQEHFAYRAETEVAFDPVSIQQAAGLTTYYNRHKFFFCGVTFREDVGRCLTLFGCEGDWPDGRLKFHLADPWPLPGAGAISLAVECSGPTQRFQIRDGGRWRDVGPALDASLLSDEAGRGEHGSFTGNFVGMAAFDITGAGRPADFPRFSYEPK